MCLYERQHVAAATFVITVTACSPQYSSQAQIMTACHQPTVSNMAERYHLLPDVQKLIASKMQCITVDIRA